MIIGLKEIDNVLRGTPMAKHAESTVVSSDQSRTEIENKTTKEKGFDLVAHLHRQRDFSLRTFGPGERTAGVLDHLRKELRQVTPP